MTAIEASTGRVVLRGLREADREELLTLMRESR